MKDKDAVITSILHYVESGLSITDACSCSGVSRQAFYRWIKSDHRIKVRMSQAEALGRLELVKRVIRGAEMDWRASAWMLERRYPKEWGRKKIMPEQSRDKEGSGVLVRVPKPL